MSRPERNQLVKYLDIPGGWVVSGGWGQALLHYCWVSLGSRPESDIWHPSPHPEPKTRHQKVGPADEAAFDYWEMLVIKLQASPLSCFPTRTSSSNFWQNMIAKPLPSLSATLRHCPAWVALIALLCVGQTLQEYQLSQDWVINRLAVSGVWPPLMRSQCDPDLSNVETGARNATSWSNGNSSSIKV